jgi:hypothetical protein
VTVPLYAYDLTFLGFAPERWILKLEREGLAKIVRHKKGPTSRAVMYKRPGDPEMTTVRDYMGKAYSFHQDLDDGHPWSLKPLAGQPRHRSPSGVQMRYARRLGVQLGSKSRSRKSMETLRTGR